MNIDRRLLAGFSEVLQKEINAKDFYSENLVRFSGKKLCEALSHII